MKIKTIIIKDVILVDTAISTDNGDLIFSHIHEGIKNGYVVHLDFAGIIIMTTAFLNASIGQLYSVYNSDQLNEHLKLINVATDDKILFKKVIERAKQYFENKKDFDHSADNII
ncbi:MAG: STAS-like domain-containing protein [Marinifilaceae bacterium]|jgi:hypothetical protein|nr:STAS-like domain-containing protein [Marinifilaceae bacterium]